MISACRGSTSIRKCCDIWEGYEEVFVAKAVLPLKEISVSSSTVVLTVTGSEILRGVSLAQEPGVDPGCVSIGPLALPSELGPIAVDEEGCQRVVMMNNNSGTGRLLN